MIDSRTVDEIFFMVPDILEIHEKFLAELKARLDSWDSQQKVGDAFIETFSKTEVLETYTSFVNNCSRAKDAIKTTKQCRPSFARFLEATAREHKGKLSLDNLLIKPVQKFRTLGYGKGSTNIPSVTGIPHGHTGHVRFLTFVETNNCSTATISSNDNSNSYVEPKHR
uniref:DH domain-containing protein n=1 Tax=Megaselia scalaris TaxID=36166 RepID=T1GAN9_MEGSC